MRWCSCWRSSTDSPQPIILRYTSCGELSVFTQTPNPYCCTHTYTLHWGSGNKTTFLCFTYQLKIDWRFFFFLQIQANGLDERFNQTMLSKFVQENKESWDGFLDTCTFAYNTSCHKSTLHTPFEVMFGRQGHHHNLCLLSGHHHDLRPLPGHHHDLYLLPGHHHDLRPLPVSNSWASNFHISTAFKVWRWEEHWHLTLREIKHLSATFNCAY